MRNMYDVLTPESFCDIVLNCLSLCKQTGVFGPVKQTPGTS